MNLKFNNKKISGILTILPGKVVKFEDGISNYNFSYERSMKLKQIMGYNTTRIVEEGTCVSDLCIFGLNYLIDNKFIQKDEIDALILVTQSPDHFIPPTSNIIQGALELKNDMICMDINHGCAGFLIGLFQAFLLLDQDEINKVVLLNADILSRKVSKMDRNSHPLIGDAASVTVVEKSTSEGVIHANIKMDGTLSNVLTIPAGGFRMPSTQLTAEMKEDAAGNLRSADHLVMKGDEVFKFVQREVPPLIEELLAKADAKREDVDYFLFHQPNKFMLQKIADALNVPHYKMPYNVVENFGNASGVTIPTAIAHNIGELLLNKQLNLCFAGFGVGLTWASMLITVGHLSFCKIIEY